MTVKEQAAKARQAALELQGYDADTKNKILFAIADGILARSAEILKANAIDLDAMEDKSSAFYDRLTLTAKRIDAMVEGVMQVAKLDDPVGEVTDEWTRPSGITIKKVRSPLGVIAIIYEARPNVTVDAAVLCIKSGNAVVLRGSKAALNSNREIFKVMRDAIENAGYNTDIIQFIDDADRESVKELLACNDSIDLVIPRGGEGLKHFILENSDIPVLASAGGNCHIYVEKSANLEKALDIIENAKCQKPSTCNAVEHILVDDAISEEFIPALYARMREKGVEVLGDESACELVADIKPAKPEDYETEFLALKLTVKAVNNYREAIDIINANGTKHSEAILTENEGIAKEFTTLVDAAATYVNSSTRFTDGFEFGFGAEMGISTSKIHARGPIGLTQLTSERYIVTSDYKIRNV